MSDKLTLVSEERLLELLQLVSEEKMRELLQKKQQLEKALKVVEAARAYLDFFSTPKERALLIAALKELDGENIHD